LTEKRLGGRGRGGSSGTWHAIAFDRRNPFVGVYPRIYPYFYGFRGNNARQFARVRKRRYF